MIRSVHEETVMQLNVGDIFLSHQVGIASGISCLSTEAGGAQLQPSVGCQKGFDEG